MQVRTLFNRFSINDKPRSLKVVHARHYTNAKDATKPPTTPIVFSTGIRITGCLTNCLSTAVSRTLGRQLPGKQTVSIEGPSIRLPDSLSNKLTAEPHASLPLSGRPSVPLPWSSPNCLPPTMSFWQSCSTKIIRHHSVLLGLRHACLTRLGSRFKLRSITYIVALCTATSPRFISCVSPLSSTSSTLPSNTMP